MQQQKTFFAGKTGICLRREKATYPNLLTFHHQHFHNHSKAHKLPISGKNGHCRWTLDQSMDEIKHTNWKLKFTYFQIFIVIQTRWIAGSCQWSFASDICQTAGVILSLIFIRVCITLLMSFLVKDAQGHINFGLVFYL